MGNQQRINKGFTLENPEIENQQRINKAFTTRDSNTFQELTKQSRPGISRNLMN